MLFILTIFQGTVGAVFKVHFCKATNLDYKKAIEHLHWYCAEKNTGLPFYAFI